MSDRHQSVRILFEYAIAAEHYARELYREFERLFTAEPRVAAFWQRYATEETGHATWLEQAAEEDCRRRHTTRPPTPPNWNAARHVIKVPLATALAEVETLEDAYQLAHELESSEINTIFEFLLFTFADDPQATQYARDQLSEHVARLSTGFPEPYTGVRSRRALRAAG